VSLTLRRIASLLHYCSLQRTPGAQNYLFPENPSNLFHKKVIATEAAANDRKEYPRRSAVSSCV
jgi:hypothetical protein